MDSLYREVLLEHYREPQNYKELVVYDVRKKDSNPLCGDVIEIFLKLDNEGKVEDVSFQGKGCVICMATTSMLTEELKGKTLAQINELDREYILDLIQLNLTHTRIKCAMLGLVATKKGILEYESKK